MASDPDEFDCEAYLPLCRWDCVLRDRLGFKFDGHEHGAYYPAMTLPIKPLVTLRVTKVRCNLDSITHPCSIKLLYHGSAAHPFELGSVVLHADYLLQGIRMLLPVCRRVRPKYRPNMAQDQMLRALKGIAYD